MIQLVKGTKDIYGAEVKAWQEIEEKMRRLCETFGIGEIRTPVKTCLPGLRFCADQAGFCLPSARLILLLPHPANFHYFCLCLSECVCV